MITYDEALAESLEYFNGDDLAAQVFLKKYALQTSKGVYMEKTPDDMHKRLAKEFARIEAKYENPMGEEEIYCYLKDFKYIVPQGSPMAGVGNPHQVMSLSNCFVIESPYDSYGGILKTDQEEAQLMKRRGGVGFDISTIRPRGLLTANAAKTTDGIGLFMERFSNTCREVAQGGRRGALMLTISVHHPEIRTFVNIKRDLGKVTGANISVRLSDEFMQAVKDDTDVELRWPVDEKENPSVQTQVSARELWHEIIESAHASAEPGLLFWDNVKKWSPADAYENLGFGTISTNPCGEITLSPYDSCRLLLVNVVSFVKDPFTDKARFDTEHFSQVVQVAQRLMDDIVDLELECIDKILEKIQSDPEPEEVKLIETRLWNKIRKSAAEGRRTGLGVTAIGDTFAALGIKYGSEESIEMMDEIYKQLALNSYRSSVKMAEERGPFPVYDYDLEAEHPFLERIMELDPELRKNWKKFGRRNIANTTTAPAGSVSVLTQTTSGIEPAYLLSYTRRRKINPDDRDARVDFVDDLGDKWQEYDVYHHGFKRWMEITNKTKPEESPYFGATSNDINWLNKVKAQAAAQKWICHSISNTTNVPEETTIETIKDIYMTGWETGCFLPGQSVYTANGCKPIEEINRQDLVIGDDGKLHQVEDVFALKAEPRVVVDIKAKGLQGFTATADHPVAVLQCIGKHDLHKHWDKRQRRIAWVRADEISSTDYLLVPKISNNQSGMKHVTISSLLKTKKFILENGKIIPARKLPWKPGKWVKCANAKGVPNVLPLTEDVLEFIGWFIAEGHFSKRSCVRMNFNLSERTTIDRLVDTIRRTFNIEARVFETNGNGGRSLRLEFDSSIVSQFLESLVGRGSHNKHLPEFYSKLNQVQIKALISGHFEGDKGVTVSRKLAEQLFHARLLSGESPYFKENYAQGYQVTQASSRGCCGREYQNYLAYKINKTTTRAYYDQVYNISVSDVDTYTINGAVVHNCKGVTVYRDKSRSGVLVSSSAPRDGKKFAEHHAPKRPEVLPCDIYHVQVKGEKWNFFVGLYEDRPYEIFAGRSEHIHLPKSRRKGVIRKNGHYNLITGEGDNELVIKDLATVFENPTESAFTRTVSLSLRHGVPIQYLVEQIEKGADKDNEMFSLAKGLMRTLKRYIKDGTKPSVKKCPECKSSELAYQEGCLTCKSCGYSKCG